MPEQFRRVGIRLVTEQEILSKKPVNSPERAVEVIQELIGDMDRECVCILNLRASLQPMHFEITSVGTINQSMVVPREILKTSILSNAACVITLHNHPSGSVVPSEDDKKVSIRMYKAFELLGITMLDHIIVNANHEMYSLAESKAFDTKDYKIAKAAAFNEPDFLKNPVVNQKHSR